VRDIHRTWLTPRRGLVWLLPAAVALVFANGRWQLGLVALAAPFFLRLFLLTQPVVRGLALGLVIQVAAHITMWIDIIPAPGWLYYAIAATYGFTYFLPFVIDRIVAPRLAGLRSTLVLPLAWFVTEIVVQRMTPYGSWASAGYTQAGNLVLMQITALLGVAGISFGITWFGSVAAWFVVSEMPRRTRIRNAVVWASICALVLVGGVVRLALQDRPDRSVRVAMILPSVDLSRAFNRAMYASIGIPQDELSTMELIRDLARRLNEDLLERSRQEAEAGAQIVVWSELAGRALKEEEDGWLDRGRALAQETGVYLFMSLGTWKRQQQPPLENKVVAITPDGEIAWQHLKARPIVGAEAHLLPPAHDFVPTLDTPYGRLSAVICHDLDFPDLIRQAGQQNVDLLFGPSADWAAIKTIHARMAVTRAVENGFTLVRPTYAGLSVVADPYGRMVAQSDDLALTERSFVTQVPVYSLRTIYPTIAGFLPWLAALALVGLILLPLRRKQM